MSDDAARKLRRHLINRGIHDARVLDVMERTRRELFVPADLASRAYEDSALPIGEEQTISQPYVVALMTQELKLAGEETVLEIGTGSGYQTAILAQLCRRVVTVERIPSLADSAQQVLQQAGILNVDYVLGDGTLGYEDGAPYDAIIVTAAAPDVPAPLYRQLRVGGRMVIPIGGEYEQSLYLFEKQTHGPVRRELCGCRFVKLIGDAGWQPWE